MQLPWTHLCKTVLRGLQERGALPRGGPVPGGEDWLANPVLPEDILHEAVSFMPPHGPRFWTIA